MRGVSSFVSRYGLLLLWMAFAPITASAARNPGFVLNPESVPYPWRAALLTWLILGAVTAVLYALVRLRHGVRYAFALAVLLVVFSAMTTVTDMPGYSYVPLQYHLVLTLVLGLAWAGGAVARAGRKDTAT